MKRKMKHTRQKVGEIEAIHIVAAALDAHKKLGTPEYDEAKRFQDEITQMWRDKLWSKAEAVVTWTKASFQMPDAETTVLMAIKGGDEPVCAGYWDGEEWLFLEGMAVSDGGRNPKVTHWAHLPDPPSTTP